MDLNWTCQAVRWHPNMCLGSLRARWAISGHSSDSDTGLYLESALFGINLRSLNDNYILLQLAHSFMLPGDCCPVR